MVMIQSLFQLIVLMMFGENAMIVAFRTNSIRHVKYVQYNKQKQT